MEWFLVSRGVSEVSMRQLLRSVVYSNDQKHSDYSYRWIPKTPTNNTLHRVNREPTRRYKRFLNRRSDPLYYDEKVQTTRMRCDLIWSQPRYSWISEIPQQAIGRLIVRLCNPGHSMGPSAYRSRGTQQASILRLADIDDDDTSRFVHVEQKERK